jgi:hypothetical protein
VSDSSVSASRRIVVAFNSTNEFHHKEQNSLSVCKNTTNTLKVPALILPGVSSRCFCYVIVRRKSESHRSLWSFDGRILLEHWRCRFETRSGHTCWLCCVCVYPIVCKYRSFESKEACQISSGFSFKELILEKERPVRLMPDRRIQK